MISLYLGSAIAMNTLVSHGAYQPEPQASVISIDPGIRYQTWEGWGTSLAWWAHIVGNYPNPVRNQLIDQVMGGLKLNIVRYNIGGGEAPGLNSMEVRARIPGYLSVNGVYDWTADAGQRYVLNRSKQLGANRFEAFSNSPPYFMTISGSVTGAADGGNNLKPESVDAFANYMATVVDHFKTNWGIRFETLSPMNEPAANWWKSPGRQEGCGVSIGERQSNLILATRKALDAKSLKVGISASEESFNSWAVTAWDALSQPAKDATLRLNTHCYGGTSQHWVNHRAARDGKRLWMSEYGDGDASGMSLARQIVRDIRVMMPTAWVYWQVIDGGYGWGCLDVDLNNHSQKAVVNRKYYAFSQFTRFLRPGCQFISIGDGDSVAALDRDRLIIVSVSDSDRKVTYDLSKFTGKRSVVQCVRTSPTENAVNAKPVQQGGGKVTVSLPKDSVCTTIIDGCRFGGRLLNGFYNLESLRTGNLLEVPEGSWTEGQWMGTWPANGGRNQQWRFVGQGDGGVRLVNRESGMVLSLWDNADKHFPVLQWTGNGDATQDWLPIAQPNGTFRMESRLYPGQSLVENPSIGNGWPDVAIYPWYAGKEQQWRLRSVNPLYPAP